MFTSEILASRHVGVGQLDRVNVGVLALAACAVLAASAARAGDCPGPCAADLDGDEQVDGADLGLLLGDWGQSGVCADIDGSGTVDGADLGAVLAAWGDCPQASPCESATNLCCEPSPEPGCDGSCCKEICAADPACCEVAWDGYCIAGIVLYCVPGTPGGGGGVAARGSPLCPADLTGDGQVDCADVGLIFAAWGTFGPGDLNGDGIVNEHDVAILAAQWGPCSS